MASQFAQTITIGSNTYLSLASVCVTHVFIPIQTEARQNVNKTSANMPHRRSSRRRRRRRRLYFELGFEHISYGCKRPVVVRYERRTDEIRSHIINLNCVDEQTISELCAFEYFNKSFLHKVQKLFSIFDTRQNQCHQYVSINWISAFRESIFIYFVLRLVTFINRRRWAV